MSDNYRFQFYIKKIKIKRVGNKDNGKNINLTQNYSILLLIK